MRRDPPRAIERAVGRWIWCAEIPWLPDLLDDGGRSTISGHPAHEAFGRQSAMLRAIASAAPVGSSLQLRFVAQGSEGPDSGRVGISLIGAARQAVEAAQLGRLVTSVLPAEFPMVPQSAESTAAYLDDLLLDDPQLTQFAEIRRDVDTLDPFADSESDQADYMSPVLLPWTWSAQSMTSSLSLLRDQPGRTVIGVHIEPRRAVSHELLIRLEADVKAFANQLTRGNSENPLVIAGIVAYRRWLRELPRAALHTRVFVSSSQPISSGFPEAIGADLTRTWEAHGSGGFTGTFRVVRPRTDTEISLALDLLECGAPVWGEPDRLELNELMFLFEPAEASIPFRLPVMARGGLPGVTTAQLNGIQGGAVRKPGARGGSVVLGESLSGGDFDLSLEEINRHVLVAGLPGFGKTTTVQSILAQVSNDHQIPFLVIDPAKSDYESLRASVPTLRRIRLSPSTAAFNPFAVPSGSSASAHGGRVLAAFDAALRLSERWPAGWIILGRAIFDAYSDTPVGRAPTMRSVYAAIGDAIRGAHLSRDANSDVRAALLGRIEYLVTGPLSNVLLADSRSGIDWAEILATPTVIELGAFAAPTERTLLFSLVVAGLISYREANPEPKGLAHVTVLEEAHRFLGAEGGNAEGVRMFADAIAELRGSGEGFIVVDQAPSLLHPSVNKFTGSKIVHRLVDLDERRIMGSTMLLDDRQQQDIARLPSARAAVFTSEAESATVVNIRQYTNTRAERMPPDSESLGAYRIEPVYCMGCNDMCVAGRPTLAQAALRRELIAKAELVDLVPICFEVAGGNSAQARCVAAAELGQRFGADPGELRRNLSWLDRRIHEYVQLQKEHE